MDLTSIHQIQTVLNYVYSKIDNLSCNVFQHMIEYARSSSIATADIISATLVLADADVNFILGALAVCISYRDHLVLFAKAYSRMYVDYRLTHSYCPCSDDTICRLFNEYFDKSRYDTIDIPLLTDLASKMKTYSGIHDKSLDDIKFDLLRKATDPTNTILSNAMYLYRIVVWFMILTNDTVKQSVNRMLNTILRQSSS